MKVLHLHLAFPPSTYYGGPTQSVFHLCSQLAASGAAVRVVTSNADGPANLDVPIERWSVYDGIDVFYAKRWGKSLFAPSAFFGLREAWRWADAIHYTGFFSALFPIVVLRAHLGAKPLVLSPRGSLIRRALQRSPVRKRLFLNMIGRPLRHGVDTFHATSEEEARELRELVPGARVAVIPNGVEVPEALPEREPNAAPYLLYLGRLHPYKQVERIIEAFARASAGTTIDGRRLTGAPINARSSVVGGQQATADGRRQTDAPVNAQSSFVGARSSVVTTNWSLLIAGDGEEKYKASLRKLTEELGLTDAVRFVGHADGEEKARLLANAQALILASKSENFGMSVAEALAHGTPCVVTKTAPWEGLESESCGLWVNDSVEALAEGMNCLMALSPEERRAMGARGREWMKRDFSWESVAKQMIELYENVIAKRR
jgi:glycosyltransferase involved in cell wall biosynthesis